MNTTHLTNANLLFQFVQPPPHPRLNYFTNPSWNKMISSVFFKNWRNQHLQLNHIDVIYWLTQTKHNCLLFVLFIMMYYFNFEAGRLHSNFAQLSKQTNKQKKNTHIPTFKVLCSFNKVQQAKTRCSFPWGEKWMEKLQPWFLESPLQFPSALFWSAWLSSSTAPEKPTESPTLLSKHFII